MFKKKEGSLWCPSLHIKVDIGKICNGPHPEFIDNYGNVEFCQPYPGGYHIWEKLEDAKADCTLNENVFLIKYRKVCAKGLNYLCRWACVKYYPRPCIVAKEMKIIKEI